MNEARTPRRPVPIVPIVLVTWGTIYLLMMSAHGWQWRQPGARDLLTTIFGFGAVPDGILRRFGAAAPVHVNAGDWQRLLTGPLLHVSLLNLLLVGWWWASLARGLRGLVGIGAVLLVMIGGAAAGSLVHAQVHPDSFAAGPGPFGWVTALIGLQMGIGLFGGLANGKQLVWSAVFSLVVVGLLMWFFGQGRALDDPLLGLHGLGASFGTGALLPLLLGARRLARRTNPIVRPLATVAVLGCLGAIAVQVPKTLRAEQSGALRAFLYALDDAERKTRRVYDEAHKPWQRYTQGAKQALDEVQRHPFRDELENKETLQTYVEAMRKIANLDMVDPHARLVACRRALRRWYEAVEKDLRRAYGLMPREPSQLHRWGGP